MQLSKHFKLEEFEKSMTATRKGIENKAGSGEIKNLTDLCYGVLEPVRAKFDKPIIVTSGYRSPELNRAIGSKSDTSQHCKGEAVDIECLKATTEEVSRYIHDNLDFDQLILEFYTPGQPNSGWTHVSYKKEGNRKSVLTASKKNGKTVYTNGLNI